MIGKEKEEEILWGVAGKCFDLNDFLLPVNSGDEKTNNMCGNTDNLESSV